MGMSEFGSFLHYATRNHYNEDLYNQRVVAIISLLLGNRRTNVTLPIYKIKYLEKFSTEFKPALTENMWTIFLFNLIQDYQVP